MEQSQGKIRFKVEGQRSKEALSLPQELAGLVRGEARVEAFTMETRTRAAVADDIHEIDLNGDDILELDLEDGIRIWMTAEEFRRDFSGQGERSSAQSVRVASHIESPQKGERGVLKWIVKGLKLIGFDPVEGAASKLAEHIDNKKGLNGLYALPLRSDKLTLLPDPAVPHGPDPLLIFIHGTMSSTEGSFGGLWSEQQGVRRRIADHYGDRIYAFEHKTFTESPIENALSLVDALPVGATLHLVSHSRGGMIGELLCRAGRIDAEPIDDADVALFSASPLADMLRRLGSILVEKRLRIERFVRVACPARGTTLASGRLDRCLSLLGTGLSSLDKSGWAGDIGWLISGILKERTDPKTMPGIEAMMPESTTVKLLNRPGVTVASDLRVIAGDYDGDGILGWLGDWATEGFFGSETDVVVNTPSMYGGATRRDGGWFAYVRGPKVYHFSYFKQARSAALLADGLLLDSAVDARFAPLASAPDKDKEIARGILFDLAGEKKGKKLLAGQPSAGGIKPLAVVVPGIMGTHLKSGDKRIWLDLDAIFEGKFTRLEIDRPEVETDGIVRMAYADFVDYLSDSHEVLVFPYDWRKSLRTEGGRFARFMAEVLSAAEKNGRPVRVVAHSMGGLLARMSAVLAPEEGGTDWWKRLKSLRSSRLVMAGTPNGGSWVVPHVLTGRDSIIKNLAALDIRHDRKDLLKIVGEFEGFLEMLPVDGDCFDPKMWQDWRKDNEKWPLPDAALLAKCAVNRSLLDRFDFHGDAPYLCYIAGHDTSTPAGIDASGSKLRFLSSNRGDGRVLWESGIPRAEGVKVSYIDVAHGDLLNHRKSFAGIRELLDTGMTTILRNEPPAVRAVTGEPELREAPVPYYPDSALLIRSALGMGLGRRELDARPSGAAGLKVTVCHGDLGAARHPVAVGHYLGDAINGAEAAINARLCGSLQRRHCLGIYPGDDGTSDVFFDDNSDWGAIVVGLGQVGDLTAERLTRFFASALLRYVTVRPRCPDISEEKKAFKVSATLIGSGAGWGLGIRDSVRALIDGTRRANEHLAALDGVRITELELLELYEDRAIQALAAVRDLSALGYTGQVDLVPILRAGSGGRCRASSEATDGWWQRVRIDATDDGDLKYSTITGLARVEERVQASQRELVDTLIDRAVSSKSVSEAEMAAIYNLVTPNALKGRAADQGDLLLMLDPRAAGYPWEMMHVGEGGQRQPLALRAGLIRQLALQEYRERPSYSTELRALVVADPALPENRSLGRLPGAFTEGEAVEKALEKGMQVTSCLGGTSRDILTALFENEYRILHLAGHGVYRWEKKSASHCCTPAQTKTGMVIDWRLEDDQPLLLTEVEVGQMTRVPELVFINCCHLGVKPQTDTLLELTGQNRFAGDLATAFIKMGVRAVIAAGWAVDDTAAKVFASTFYDALLDGHSFGDAVRTARRKSKESGGSNTWAAYQCYGDPGFRLHDNHKRQRDKVYLSPREALCDIRAVTVQLKDEWSGVRVDSKTLLKELERIVAAIPYDWFVSNGALRAALGDAYGAHNSFDKALEHYEAAGRCEDGQCQLSALEQLFNLRVRMAAKKKVVGDAGIRRKVETIEKYVHDFESLLKQVGPSKERFCLLAGAYKRIAYTWAELNDLEATAVGLQKMVDAYEEGMTIDPADPYPALHWAAGRIVQGFRDEALKETIRRGRELADARFRENPRFWDGIHIADADLLLLMLELHGMKPAEINKRADEIAVHYKEQIDERGTENGIDSIKFQFLFYLRFTENGMARMVKRVQKSVGL